MPLTVKGHPHILLTLNSFRLFLTVSISIDMPRGIFKYHRFSLSATFRVELTIAFAALLKLPTMFNNATLRPISKSLGL